MRSRPKPLMVVAVLFWFATIGLAAPGPGDPAPGFTEPDTAGVFHSLSDYAGRAILLNFWQSG
jgi:hypothetical protein